MPSMIPSWVTICFATAQVDGATLALDLKENNKKIHQQNFGTNENQGKALVSDCIEWVQAKQIMRKGLSCYLLICILTLTASKGPTMKAPITPDPNPAKE